jgi:hypothetical protein
MHRFSYSTIHLPVRSSLLMTASPRTGFTTDDRGVLILKILKIPKTPNAMLVEHSLI